jgi:XTP/dITP diphosphohydrolase
VKIVLASNNAGKIRELKSLLQQLPIDLIPQSDLGVKEVEETGLTFIENALIKARHAARLTGLPTIADDSGLAVDALNGAPGIYSARFAGPKANAKDNINKLLHDLHDIPDERRSASFHCVLVFMSRATDPIPLVCNSEWSGMILHAPQGEEGFGYDPIFYVPSEKKSAAALSLAIKNKISHRGKAMQALLGMLPDKLMKNG